MGDTGAELSGLLMLILLGFGVIGVVGFTIIDKIETGRKKGQLTSTVAGEVSTEAVSPATSPLTNKYVLWLVCALPVLALLMILGAIFLKPTTPLYSMGQQGVSAGWAVRVISFQELDKTQVGSGITPAPVTLTGGKAKPVWALVQLELTNLATQPQSLDPASLFELHDSANNVYPLSAAPGLDNLLGQYGTALRVGLSLNPNQPGQFYLLYDVDSQASGLELLLNQTPNPRFSLSPGRAR